MKPHLLSPARHRLLASAALLLLAGLLRASEPAAAPAPVSLPDLTLGNFFSAGWNVPWQKFARGNGTPDMSLLRVQTNFLVQLWRTDFLLQVNERDKDIGHSDFLNETIEYAFNRRFMLGVVGSYRWDNSRSSQDEDGPSGAAFVRLQLVESAHSSLAAIVRAGLPARDFGERQTTVSLALAGWQDLAPLGLGRTGLYWHVQAETFAGPEALSQKRNDLTYDLSLAHTWTAPEALLGNATTFIEGYGKTDLDGARAGLTTLTITPGLRATLAHRHILMVGVEFPLTDPEPFERIVRLTYIYNF